MIIRVPRKTFFMLHVHHRLNCASGALKGVRVEQLMELRFSEPVIVDSDRLVELCVRMGEARAEEMIAMSVDNLWRGLDALGDAYRYQRLNEVSDRSKGMSQIAENLGLNMFARVARDVEICALRHDGPALSASMSRLHRIAESSINSVWDLSDISG